MINFFKKFFGTKPTVSPCPEAPYKVEKPASEPAPAPVAEVVAETAPTKKKGGKKPGAPKKQGGNKPRKPKAPKQPKA